MWYNWDKWAVCGIISKLKGHSEIWPRQTPPNFDQIQDLVYFCTRFLYVWAQTCKECRIHVSVQVWRWQNHINAFNLAPIHALYLSNQSNYMSFRNSISLINDLFNAHMHSMYVYAWSCHQFVLWQVSILPNDLPVSCILSAIGLMLFLSRIL